MINHPLFVYGSLRQNGHYHYLIEQWLESVEPAYTYGKMYHYPTQGNIGYYPYLVHGNEIIYGELMRFSDTDRAFEVIDNLEDNGTVYEREIVTVINGNNESVYAWVYFIKSHPPIQGKWVETGDWISEVRKGSTLS